MTAPSAAELVERLDAHIKSFDTWSGPGVLSLDDARAIRSLLAAAPPREPTKVQRHLEIIGTRIMQTAEDAVAVLREAHAALGAGGSKQSAATPSHGEPVSRAGRDGPQGPQDADGSAADPHAGLIAELGRLADRLIIGRADYSDVPLVQRARAALSEQLTIKMEKP